MRLNPDDLCVLETLVKISFSCCRYNPKKMTTQSFLECYLTENEAHLPISQMVVGEYSSHPSLTTLD